MRPSKVLLVSSIITVIDPGTSIPAWAKSAGSTCWASVFISSMPRLCERRRAGSIVRQRTRLPRRAAARPRAAVVVVLPTPPQPTQRMTRRESSRGESPDDGFDEAVTPRRSSTGSGERSVGAEDAAAAFGGAGQEIGLAGRAAPAEERLAA